MAAAENERRKKAMEPYASQVEAWKKEHGTVKAFFVEDKDGLKAVFFRQPKRSELSAAEAMSINAETGSVDRFVKAERHIVDCHLGGDYIISKCLEDTSIFMPLARFCLYELLDEKKSSWETC